MLLLELVPPKDHEGKVRGEHDGGHDRGRDGQHERDDPRCGVEHAARGKNGHKREEREAGGDGVQHEQDGESLEDEIRQVRLVRHARDVRRVNRVPKLGSDAFALIVENRRLVQRATKMCDMF